MDRPQDDTASAPARDQAAGRTALLIIDMINDLDFPDAEMMREAAGAAAERIAYIRDEAERANLPVLLPKLGVSRLILTGMATDICVLFTAADAHMRDYALWVPEDAVAGTSRERQRWALELMRQSMKATTTATTEMTLDHWFAAAATGGAGPQ